MEQRLDSLRRAMAERGYDALVVPRADEFLGEYIPERNERLHWLTGFTGSAGAAVVLADRAAMFVDGRYTVQVQSQVRDDLYSFHHLVDEPPLQWLAEQLESGQTVACDPRLHSYQWCEQARETLGAMGVSLVCDSDNLVDRCWTERPEEVIREALLLDEAFTGESAESKRVRMAALVAQVDCDAALVFAPDSVSWLLNVRGTDMLQLPVLLSFALLDVQGNLALFTDDRRLPAGFRAHVGEGVEVYPPASFTGVLAEMSGRRILADPANASAWTQQAIVAAGAELVAGKDPVLLAKACKNPVELAGTRAAHLRDGVAVSRFLAWLAGEVAAGNLHDEAVLADELYRLRAGGEYFHACSFDTISAAGANAAMCHYNHMNGEPGTLQRDSVYLCDSGGQYLDGTTDVTRTVAIGDPGPEVRRLFTLVLKGHIALDRARFPRGTTGMQLDALARQYLWAEGFDFDHGTGHGVGVFLSVHEGPQRISKTAGDTALMPGMIVSNEPGYYRDGRFGMRCENLLVVRECDDADAETPMLGFEALTLAPFDVSLLDMTLLTPEEVDWLNAYHARVADSLQPFVSGADAAWLASATAVIGH